MDRTDQIAVLDGYIRDLLSTNAYETAPDMDPHGLAVYLVNYHIENTEDLPEWFDSADRTYMVERVEESLSDYRDQAREEAGLVANLAGTLLNAEAAVARMDDDLREQLHMTGLETEQEFVTAYEKAHQEKFGEPWELSKENPVW